MKDLQAIATRVDQFSNIESFVEHFDLSEAEVNEIERILRSQAGRALTEAEILKAERHRRKCAKIGLKVVTPAPPRKPIDLD
jgi:hypothetical protein